MKAINKIMACVDLSDYSKETMEYALALGRGFMAEILIFNVIHIRDVQAVRKAGRMFPDIINDENYVEGVEVDRRKQIHELIGDHFPSDMGKMKILIRTGIPYQEILRAIETEEIDLVVIGNKGRSNVAGTLFGSNVEKVFRHSPVPIVSVRNRAKFSRNK